MQNDNELLFIQNTEDESLGAWYSTKMQNNKDNDENAYNDNKITSIQWWQCKNPMTMHTTVTATIHTMNSATTQHVCKK